MAIDSGRLDGAEGWIVREQKLRAEVERLTRERDAAIARAEAAERKLAMAKESLAFYSIRTSYVARTGNDSPISRDGFGERARAALAELEKDV